MSFFREGPGFDPYTDNVERYGPVKRLSEMQKRAKSLVKDRSIKHLEEASETITWMTDEYFNEVREAWISAQVERGGSVLNYLEYEDRTYEGLRELIEHHGHNADLAVELDFPRAENTSDLEALESSLQIFDLDSRGFPDAKPYEYLAVLALDLIASTVNYFSIQPGDSSSPELLSDLTKYDMRRIADVAVDLMEVVCRAEQLRDQHAAQKQMEAILRDKEKDIPERVESLAKKKRSLAASLAASARHKETSRSKSEALRCWDATGAAFSTRTAFARNKCRCYGVTEKTLYSWITAYERLKVE